ncbi:MAG TPA: NAD(P)-dependent oxidoreductase [Bryobacteraceae bacterium]|nr:NAD(P)-dependent oxidoreductase [Bryobacteraceae bacterium]
MSSANSRFRVALSADFLDGDGKLVFPDIGLSLLDGVPGLSYEFLNKYWPEYGSDQLKDYDVIVSLKPRVTAASLEGVDRLCAIGRCGVGYDNVDLEACTARDIAVFITPDAVVRPVAQSIVLFVLALSHNLVLKDRMMREGKWAESSRQLGRGPRGRTVGTVGLGNIASEAVRLLRPFDVERFLAYDPYAPPGKAAELGVAAVRLDDLMSLSDYVLINCPLTAQTRGLIGERQIARMKPDAVLINTARGGIVDQAALTRALTAGRIRGAALDVFEKEPLEIGSPILELDNVILTSHSVAWTEELFRDMGRADCEGALSVFNGQIPRNVVNKDVLNRPGFLDKLRAYKVAYKVSSEAREQ